MQAYSDPTRENETYALPDVEVFEARACVISDCENGCENSSVPWWGNYEVEDIYCPQCDGKAQARFAKAPLGIKAFWYWFCFPGCMPDSSPFGPFETEEEALADMRETFGD